MIQTLTNLLVNAIKFSRRGGTVRVATNQVNGFLITEVTDRGKASHPTRSNRSFTASSRSTPPTPGTRVVPAWAWRSAAASSSSTAG